MISWAITRLLEGYDLTRAEARDVMGTIMRGEATQAQIGGFLVALRFKGETAAEIAGCAEAMREHVLAGEAEAPGPRRHGRHRRRQRAHAQHLDRRRARRSRSGRGRREARQPRRLVELGLGGRARGARLQLELPPERIEQSIDELGFGFLFAPTHHPAMKHAAPVRRELATRTVFNVLGPLTNPAGARAQVVGVFAADLVPTIAAVLAELGAHRAFVVHGAERHRRALAGRAEPRRRGRARAGRRADDRPARARRPALLAR